MAKRVSLCTGQSKRRARPIHFDHQDFCWCDESGTPEVNLALTGRAVTDYNHLLRRDGIFHVAARPSWPTSCQLNPAGPTPRRGFLFAELNWVAGNRSEPYGLSRCRPSFAMPRTSKSLPSLPWLRQAPRRRSKATVQTRSSFGNPLFTSRQIKVGTGEMFLIFFSPGERNHSRSKKLDIPRAPKPCDL
jgi:hypothetical protein